jgi:hypothetical protein
MAAFLRRFLFMAAPETFSTEYYHETREQCCLPILGDLFQVIPELVKRIEAGEW